ncbi:MAG: tripartite tricarboxylate transporter permease [Clostridiales bacterium]|nr:tripartite tricarboxylate transporter permease [Clostridiales bacterium]
MGRSRFTFGQTFLMGGINMIPAVIGLFSISQVLNNLMNPIQVADKSSIAQFKSAKVHIRDMVRYPITYVRSAILGVVIGIIPGTGGDVASYVAHNIGKMFSKEDNFGTGAREGVACCESANNAVTGGTLIPTLTLGVPGNATTAILMGALTIHGLIPGYGLFTTQKSITYPFIAALFIANVIMLLIGLFGAKHFALVTLTPKNILSACVLMLSIMGSYAIRGNMKDVVVMLVFGIIGFFMKTYGYNVVPIVLGLILGPIAEEGLSQALTLNQNSLSQVLGSMLTRPICVVLMIFMVISVGYPIISERKSKSS